jgi:hypothetical protein
MPTITDRIDEVTRIPVHCLKPQPPAPRSVKIEISPRCNCRCGFCALRTRDVQPKRDMDFDLFKRVTTEMREAGVQEIGVFYLGESFMNPRLLVDCIGFAKKELSARCFDANANWTMSDLTQQSFMQAWNSVAFTALRAAHLKRDVRGTVCEACVAYS